MAEVGEVEKAGGCGDAEWQTYAEPSDAHKILQERFHGEFTYKTEFFKEGQEEPLYSSPGKGHCENIFEGRFVRVHYICEDNGMGGTFHGEETLGYDNCKKYYTSSWINNMATAVCNATGSYDAEEDVLTTTSFYDYPHGKGELKNVIKFVKDGDKVTGSVMEAFSPGKDGLPFRHMRVTRTVNS